MTMDRRRFCHCMGAVGLQALGARPRRPADRPFCRFSLREGWNVREPSAYVVRRAGPEDASGVPQVVERINRTLQISPEFDIYISADEDNAFATVAEGRKILVIDVGFLANLNRVAGTEWAAISVIAHEVGHHIDGFSGGPEGELRADYWSGQSLQRLGSSRTAATRAILTFGTDVDTQSHPSKHRRAAVIARGWDDAAGGRIDRSFCEEC